MGGPPTRVVARGGSVPTRWPTAIKFLESQEGAAACRQWCPAQTSPLSRQERRGSRGGQHSTSAGEAETRATAVSQADLPGEGGYRQISQASGLRVGQSPLQARDRPLPGGFDLQNRKRVWARARARVGGAAPPGSACSLGLVFVPRGARGALGASGPSVHLSSLRGREPVRATIPRCGREGKS